MNHQGFSFSEVLVACFIVMASIMALVEQYRVTVVTSVKTRHQSQAILVADNQQAISCCMQLYPNSSMRGQL